MHLAAYNVEADLTGKSVTVKAVSVFTGKNNVRTLPLTLDDFVRGHLDYRRGAPIQVAFPTLSADDREFLKSGCTPAEWRDVMGSPDDDDYYDDDLDGGPCGPGCTCG